MGNVVRERKALGVLWTQSSVYVHASKPFQAAVQRYEEQCRATTSSSLPRCPFASLSPLRRAANQVLHSEACVFCRVLVSGAALERGSLATSSSRREFLPTGKKKFRETHETST